MIENITFWVNGFGFGAFLICASSLLLVHRKDTMMRKASIMAAICLYYLALRTLTSSFVPITSSMYLGHGIEFRAMFGMFTAFIVSFFMLELTHCMHVNARLVIKHLLFPVSVIASFVVMASLGVESVLPILFRIYGLYVLFYVMYFVVRTYRAYLKFEKELSEAYVNPEGRSVRWFWYVSGTALLLFVGNVFASAYIDNSLPGDIYRFFCTFLWCFVSYRVTLLREAKVRFENDPLEEEEKEEDIIPMESRIRLSAEERNKIEIDNKRIRAEQAVDFIAKLKKMLLDKGLLFDEDLTRDDVTREMVVTHITLGRYLHDATGLTFAAYINDLRLEHIAHLLLTTDDNIDTIYYSCGFRSRTTFYRAFARKYNCSPVEYRRNHPSLSA